MRTTRSPGPVTSPGAGDACRRAGDRPEATMTARPRTADRPPSPVLTMRQEERRRRILRATVALASRGGFDAVQMREVAEVSHVALGTLYRYFPSKIHLLVAALCDQLEQLHATLAKRPPTAPDPRARVAEALLRAFRAMRREPLLADAMVRALTFADRSAAQEVARVSELTTAIILDAFGGAGPADEGQLSAVRVIERTWLSTLVDWLSGRACGARVTLDVTTACRLLEVRPTGTGPADSGGGGT